MLATAKCALKFVGTSVQEFAHGYVSLPWTITGWYGRLGNNIQQVCLGVLAAKMHGLRFISPTHDLIDRIAINVAACDRFLPKWRSRFFRYRIDSGSTADFDLPYEFVRAEFRGIALAHVRPALKLSIGRALEDDELVVHLRGGDIFDRSLSPNAAYVQNPLAFYKTLIARHRRTIVVAEPGGLNPVLAELSKLPTVTVASGSIGDDFATLLQAKSLASSGVGTFALAAALCSDNLRTFYCSDRYLREHLNPEMLRGVDVQCIRLSGYTELGKWNNSDAQRRLMLAYDLGVNARFEQLNADVRSL